MVNESKLIENIFDSVITGIISFFLPFLLSSVYKLIISLNYKISIINVRGNIPTYIYLILFIPFLYWLVRKYIKSKMNEGIKSIITYNSANFEYLDEIECNGLIWIVQLNRNSLRKIQNNIYLDDYEMYKEAIDNLNIGFYPRCPKCGAELYFTRHHLWYTYDCVNPECSFIKRTWQSKDKMRDIAKKLYKFKLKFEFLDKKK